MESSSSSCNIELKVMYARDLTAFNFFQNLNVYVVVSIINKDQPEKEIVKKQKTLADKEGDGNPEWNHEMVFDLNHYDSLEDYRDLFLVFSFRHEGVMFGDKDIGEVHVPFSDLIEEFNGILRFVNYEIRSPDGKPNGILNFSYKVNGKCKEHLAGIGSGFGQITGYHHHHHDHHHDHHHHHHDSLERIQYPSIELEETTTTLYSVEFYPPPPGVQAWPYPSPGPPPPQLRPPSLPPQPPPERLMFPHPILPPPPMSHEVCYYPPPNYPPSPRPYPPWGPNTNPYGYGAYETHHGQY